MYRLKSNFTRKTLDSLKMGARCLKINPLGSHLATGDRNGNIRIYDLNTLESICMIEAHDGEVLYLQYSQPESGRLLLASSSRDRLIHIFDASRITYDLLQTLGEPLIISIIYIYINIIQIDNIFIYFSRRPFSSNHGSSFFF